MAVRTYADAVRAALMRPAVKSAQLTYAELLGLPEKKDDSLTFENLVKRPAPAPKQTGSGPAFVAAPDKKGRGKGLKAYGKSVKNRGESVKAIADALRNIKNAPARALSGVGTTIDDLKSIGRKLKDAVGFGRRDVLAATPALKPPDASPTPLAIPAAAMPQAAAAVPPLDVVEPDLTQLAPPQPPEPSIQIPLAVKAPDPDAGRSVDGSSVLRGAAASYLGRARSLLTPRNMAIAGGVALAGGGAALAYKLISDHLARKREEEKRRRQQKQAFAPPPRAVPGIPGDVQWIGRFPSGNVIGRLPRRFMNALRRAKAPKAPKGGKAGLIASILATLATGGALVGSLAKAPKGATTPTPTPMPDSQSLTAMDKLLAVLKSPAAKTVGLGLGAAGLGAGAVYGGMKLRDKLRNGGIDIHISSLDDKGDGKGDDKDKSAS